MPEKKKGKASKRKLNESSTFIKEQEATTPVKKVRQQTIIPKFTATRLHDRAPGKVLVMGQGDVGQLGLGPDIMEKQRPFAVPDLTDIVDICAGGMHTVCLNSEGEVFTFGCNDEGALGRVADEGEETRPGKVELNGKAVQISAGDSHSAALLDDGRVFAWGAFRDSHGTMGLTLEGKMSSPTQVSVVRQVKMIASGTDHLLMLTKQGELFSCGCAEQGQLGRIPARGASRESRKGLNQLLIPSQVKFKKTKLDVDYIWCGGYSSFARDKNDKVYVFGLNNYKQLGLDITTCQYYPVLSNTLSNKSWAKISGDQHHTIALNSNGTVYALGRKEYGRLGLGRLEDSFEEVAEPSIVPALQEKECTDIATGGSCSFAVTKGGVLYSWGMGSSGNLGTGDEEDQWEPTQVRGKQLEGLTVVAVSAGGQHTVILATTSTDSTTPMDHS